MLSAQESNLLKETLREAQGGDLGAIARAMSRLNKPLPPANKDKRLDLGGVVWHARGGCWRGLGFSFNLWFCMRSTVVVNFGLLTRCGRDLYEAD
jgi:hypothetical protein